MKNPVSARYERIWMACDSADDLHAEYGPFGTREEAETQARIIDFRWVICITTVLLDANLALPGCPVDGFGNAIVNTVTQFFEVPQIYGGVDVRLHEPLLRLLSVEEVRSLVSGVKPMTEDEAEFFDRYEKQMEAKK